MVLQDIVVQTTVLDNIVTACRKTLPYAVAFTVEGSLKISLVTSEIIVIDVNETGEGKFKKRAKKKETINRTEDGITPPVPKRKRGRPRKVNYQEPVSESENDGDIVDNDTSGILGSESEIPDIKLETVEGVKEEVAESSDILNQQAELGMQALQSLAMQLSGEGDASSQPIEPSSSDLPATDQPPSEEKTQPRRILRLRGRPKTIITSDDGGNYQCHKCGKYYTSETNLKVHMIRHSSNKTYKCDLCDKTFKTISEKRKHEVWHSEKRAFSCVVCGRGFKTKQSVNEHKKTHMGIKPFTCEICGKHLGSKDALVYHTRKHTGEKPFQCGVCGKQLATKSALAYHARTHTGEKPYQCTYCGKGFRQHSNLVAHERIHTGEKPFKCQFCGKSFRQSANLHEHEGTHSQDKGIKPHKCSYCEKRFYKTYPMKLHERTHTGERPFKCSYCEKTFIDDVRKRKHERTHTAINERHNSCKVSTEQTESHQFGELNDVQIPKVTPIPPQIYAEPPKRSSAHPDMLNYVQPAKGPHSSFSIDRHAPGGLYYMGPHWIQENPHLGQ